MSITEVTIGDGTPFDVNHWNGSVVTGPHDQATGVTVTGKKRDGAVVPWATKKGALHYAESLKSIQWPGEEIYLITYQAFPEGDAQPVYSYYVAGPITTDVFTQES